MATSSTEGDTETTIQESLNEYASSETSDEITSVLNKIQTDINTIIRKMDSINFVIIVLGVNTAINLIIMIMLCIANIMIYINKYKI